MFYVLAIHLEIMFCPNFEKYFEDLCTWHKESALSVFLLGVLVLAVPPAELQVLRRLWKRPRLLHAIDHR